jgi:type VI protein secretion system component VasK
MDWFWHVLVICLVVIPVTIMWLAIAFELFTRRDLKWWQRVAWILFILIFPLIGSLIYLGYTWATAGRRAPGRTSALPRFGRQAPDVPDAEADLASLDRLRRNGVLTTDEFEAGKRRALERTTPDGGPSATQTVDESLQATATDTEPKHGAPS